MSKAVYIVSFKLKKGASVEGFLLAAEKLNNEYVSKRKGYISWEQLNDEDTWMDCITFASMEDAKNFVKESGNPDAVAKAFYAFINLNSCKVNIFSVEKSYS